MCCKVRDALVLAQAEKVAALEAELAAHVENGNELYAEYTRKDLIAARCSNRLIHKHTRGYIMIINGKTPIVVNGKLTRVLGHDFNVALRASRAAKCELVVYSGMETNAKLLPSKGASWEDVAETVRAGKQVQAKLDGVKTSKKSAKKDTTASDASI